MKAEGRRLAAICSEAGDLLLRRLMEKPAATRKAGHELVTSADLESEALLRQRLEEMLPGIPTVGEEADDPIPEAPFWLVDPLDGTTNFAHGYPAFAVSVALQDREGPEMGCVRDPSRGETFLALRGSGATLNGAPVRCSKASALDDALLATGFPYSRTPRDLGFDIAPLICFLGLAGGIRRSGSAALDLCGVACGRLDGFWEQHLRPWDMAAGALMVAEAGGIVEDYRGGPWTPLAGGVLAAAAGIARSMRAAIGNGGPK